MARHGGMARLLADGVYFTDPASLGGAAPTRHQLPTTPYFPKGTDFAVHAEGRLLQVEYRLNNRPRKTFGWSTPATVLAPHLTC
jgi:IS30 family transposase